MKKLIDKLVIFILSAALYITEGSYIYMIIPILVSLILSALLSYLEDERITTGAFAAYLILCLFAPVFSFFIPLICYDAVLLKKRWIWLLAFLPLAINYEGEFFLSRWIIAVFIVTAYILKHRTVSLENLRKDYRRLQDDAREISMRLEKQNNELLEKQDYEINLATLTERNRIARDIHDNVGHLLSRSILQIGALLAINKDEGTKENLRLVKGTLSEAMDSIRASVHNLHEEAVDLRTEIQKLIEGFTFCTIKFDYAVETSLEKNIKYCFIAVTKEALSNIMKHSNATEASVSIREHPALYQLVIQDNGINSNYKSENGIGLKNITDRVAAAGGNVNISTGKGFRIFISIPKK
ncbi:MAG: sensor histidine kinase [Bacillota bacterium]|nr:sensor histidine kinase [Bacillota bacterium]